MSSSHSWGTRLVAPRSGYGEFCESRGPFPTPIALAHPDTDSLSAKNQLKQPESLSERPALYA